MIILYYGTKHCTIAISFLVSDNIDIYTVSCNSTNESESIIKTTNSFQTFSIDIKDVNIKQTTQTGTLNAINISTKLQNVSTSNVPPECNLYVPLVQRNSDTGNFLYY